MPAFRFFDPWTGLENTITPAAPAKVANPAKVGATAQETLAALAGLSGSGADRTFSDAPASEPSTTTPAALSPWGEAEEERAAIVEYDSGIPRAWAEGFARLSGARPPADMPLKRWRRFVDDVGSFLDGRFCAVAVKLG
jgi:hypothetical protein